MTQAMKFLMSSGWRQGREFEHEDFTSGRAAVRVFDLGKIRDEYLAKFGFAILDDRTIETLRPYGPFLEVGAGSGYWSYELRLAGVHSLPTDPGTGIYQYFFNRLRDAPCGSKWKPWMPIERIDGPAAVAKYPGRTLLTVWPDYGEPWAAETLEQYRGSVVAYVGEGEGGCTADDRFHKLLEEHFSVTEASSIPNFFGIHDALTIYKRVAIDEFYLSRKENAH